MVEDAIASCDDERAAADRSTADPPTAAETGDAASGSANGNCETNVVKAQVTQALRPIIHIFLPLFYANLIIAP